MPTSVIRVDNLTANTTNATSLSGDINEFIAQDSVVNLYAAANSTGIRMSVFADSDIAIDDKEVSNITGTPPTIDNSAAQIDSFIVGAGTRMTVKLRETAGVSTTDTIYKLEVTPL